MPLEARCARNYFCINHHGRGQIWAHSGKQGTKKSQRMQRGKIFGKLTKEIMVAAKGGADIGSNSRFVWWLSKPKKPLCRKTLWIAPSKKGAGLLDGPLHMEYLVYEGFAPHRVPVIVECLSDNINRTKSSMNVLFRKGQLGAPGSVSKQGGTINVPLAKRPRTIPVLSYAAS